MSEAYLGEIRCFGFTFAPINWALCAGQLLPISQYSALFSIIGTTYGGNGTTNFALPNLQGSVPMHWGAGPGLSPTVLGDTLGSTTISLTGAELPAHVHTINSFQNTQTNGTKTNTPASTNWIGDSDPDAVYSLATPLNMPFSPNAIGFTGKGLPHENMQPYLALNFSICMNGIFPSRG
jgi:microcystin-dependent protein